MAEVKSYTNKSYPEESKVRIDKLLDETKPMRQALDAIDKAMIETGSPTLDILKKWAREATGYGNLMRKKFKRLEAACINEKDARYMEIKIECNTLGITFTDSTSKIDAEGYIAPLRMARDIFEAYVLSAEAIVSVARMHFYGGDKEEVTVEA